MKKIKHKKIIFLFVFFLSLFFPYYVMALGTANTAFSGNKQVYINENIDIVLYVSSVSGTTNDSGLAAFGGNLNYDSEMLELIKTESLAPFTIELVNNKFGGFGSNTIKGKSNIMRFTFKAKKLGNTIITYTGSNQPDATASPVTITKSSKKVTILPPPSDDNNLESITLDKAKFNFDKNKTDYTINVASDITSMKIEAKPADSKATIQGLGNKKLNYGNNKFSIVVTAENGNKKSYTINVIRKDDRSSNNLIDSLKIKEGDVTSKFSPNVYEYSMSVPYKVTKLSITAKLQNSKSKIDIQNNNLVEGANTAVKIIVTAENGDKRTYTINVKRAKNPNKKLSSNNYLSGISVSKGILSPKFSKEQLTYGVYLPYEIDNIKIKGEVEDTKYASVDIKGPSKLSVGNNQYKLIVTAEDETTREYILIVYRGENVLASDLTSNNYLKNISIKNGKLTTKFNKEKNVYYYTGKDIKVEASSEDKNSKVTISSYDDTFTILVESVTGEINTYLLIKKNNNYLSLIILILLAIGIFILIKKLKNKKLSRN